MDASKRLLQLRKYMDENKIGLSVVMQPDNQYYMSGFKAIVYSRPIVLVVESNSTELVIPALEEAHASKEATVDSLHVYYEHPEKASSGTSYLEALDKIVSKYPAGTTVGVEVDVIPARIYTRLKDAGYKLADIGKKIVEMRAIKDENEIELLMKSAELVNLALRESLKNARLGMSEMELDQYGTRALMDEVAKKYADATVDLFVMSPSGIERTIMPHVSSNTRKLQQGDVIIHSRQVGLNGYRVENERTFFMGEPTKDQARLFTIIHDAQKAAREAIKPGMMAKEVDSIARTIIQDAGYGQYFIHRTGHGIGLSAHEEPSLRFDSDLVLQENMVFSIEPAIMVPGFGGFRHSDTVLLTRDGAKLLTEYPRDLKDLIF